MSNDETLYAHGSAHLPGVGAPLARDPGAPSQQQAPAGARDVPQSAYAPQQSTAAAAHAISAASGEPSPADDNVVRFSEGYEAHDKVVHQVRLRQPLGGDIARLGMPVRYLVDENGEQIEIKFIPSVVNNYICELSSPPLPMPTVERLKPWDWQDCCNMIQGFFQRPAPKRAR